MVCCRYINVSLVTSLNVLPLQWAQLTKAVHTARLGLEFVFLGFFRLYDLSIIMLVYVLFYLGQLSHFCSCFGAGVTNLNEPPSSFLLPPRYCGLGAGSIPNTFTRKEQTTLNRLLIGHSHLTQLSY